MSPGSRRSAFSPRSRSMPGRRPTRAGRETCYARPSHNVRIGLNFRVAHGGGLGGVDYLQNFALALRELPAPERPEWVAYARVDAPALPVGERRGVASSVPFYGGDPNRSLRTRVVTRARRYGI